MNIKSTLFKTYINAQSLGSKLQKINNKKIVILNGSGRSGSNGFLFYKYLVHYHSDYDVKLVEPWPSSHLNQSIWKEIGQAKYIITTHQPFKVHKNQINIQFWHGIPLKRMGIMAHNTLKKDTNRNDKLWEKYADIVTSSSDLYESLMTSCMSISSHKYQKLGFPRLDYLPHPSIPKHQLLSELFNQEDDQAKIGIYMPTFRYELNDGNIIKKIKEGNFFAFSDFNIEKLNQTLIKNHQYLIIKLHPYEMRLFKDLNTGYSNIAFLNNSYLFKNNVDLYEMLGSTDFLLTDFSSIYFDYLKLNKPIIFVSNFLKQYEKVRGLLMGPYNSITPGPKVISQVGLLKILDNLESDNYINERMFWKDMMMQINDQSCDRIFNYMINLKK